MNSEIIKLQSELDRLRQVMKHQSYGLVWLDVPEAFDNDAENKLPVLKKIPNLCIKNNDDKPAHLIIEGDNYHALTCLTYTHQGKIDFIYIDPPYNTGNDGFRYKDKRILDKFPDGADVPKDSPFRHSYWLSFMKKRLDLAYGLLSPEGVMFISIDDNELANLILLCNKITKKDDNVELIIWDKVTGNPLAGSGKMKITQRFRRDHEYIVVVYKNKNNTLFNKPFEKIKTKNEYGNIDNDKRGAWISSEICKSEKKSNPSGKNYYSITTPKGRVITRQWHLSLEELDQLDQDGRIYWGKGNIIPRLKRFVNEEKATTPVSVFTGKGSTTDGNNEAKQLGIKFDNPKPLSLIIYLLKLATKEDSIVLDFFAGSGTTGHAVMLLNNENDENRQFILVNNNENNIIRDACLTRIKKAIYGYKFSGKNCSILFEKKLSLENFVNSELILDVIDEIERSNNQSKKWESIDKIIDNGVLQVIGCSKTQRFIPGLGNSFYYYKTDFIGANNIFSATDEDKVMLAQNAGDLLSIAENTLELINQNDYYQIFSNDQHSKYTAIYFREELDNFQEFVDLISKLHKSTSVYIFSWGFDVYYDDLLRMEYIKVKSIPQPILRIYEQISKL